LIVVLVVPAVQGTPYLNSSLKLGPFVAFTSIYKAKRAEELLGSILWFLWFGPSFIPGTGTRYTRSTRLKIYDTRLVPYHKNDNYVFVFVVVVYPSKRFTWEVGQARSEWQKNILSKWMSCRKVSLLVEPLKTVYVDWLQWMQICSNPNSSQSQYTWEINTVHASLLRASKKGCWRFSEMHPPDFPPVTTIQKTTVQQILILEHNLYLYVQYIQ